MALGRRGPRLDHWLFGTERLDILAVADTQARAHGTDIVASRDGHRLLIEVKGFPSDVYARGPMEGQKKPTLPATQARVWFASALMAALILRDENAESAVAIGLPDFTTYRSLADKVADSLDRLDVRFIWVHENGESAVLCKQDSIPLDREGGSKKYLRASAREAKSVTPP